MSKQIKVKFKSTITQHGEKQEIQFESIGEQVIERVDETQYITLAYEEPLIDEEGSVHVKWTLRPNQLTMMRRGTIKGKQTYQLNKKTNGFMVYEVGRLTNENYTRDISYDETGIQLTYELWINKEMQGIISIVIEIEGVTADESGN